MSLNICVLASGSSGNATLLWTDTAALLIDCGRSKKFIEDSFAALSLDIGLLKGILITHGHGDHINSGTIILSRAHGIPIYIHEETYAAVLGKKTCERIAFLDRSLVRHHTGACFTVEDFGIAPFSTFHSGGFAGRTFGFSITCGAGPQRRKVGFLTDTGKTDDAIIDALAGSDALILEANHDPELVRASSRPAVNKQWILSDYGHLSNEANARAIIEIARRSPGGPLKHIFMAHISQQHNTPQIALAQVQAHLDAHHLNGIKLLPTFHRAKSAVITL
jgi:phosphoribosyl 1,2-cyclic phosphodiesterase